MKSLVSALFTASFLHGQALDLYPQVRALVLEAEVASANMRLLKDRGNPHTWAGDILAHAGYREDAERVYAKSTGASKDPPYMLWRAWVIYGHRERAEKLIESATSAEVKASMLTSFADLLWRFGEPTQARASYETAEGIAMKIVDPTRRKQLLGAIDLGLRFVSEPPPDRISATPHPRPRFRIQDSRIPPFPITTDGFQDADPKDVTAQANSNGELMTRLYERPAAGDRTGIERITESAATPFQKALGLASLEHILIQERQPELAEHYARKIPETDSSSSLAKAEALSAAAGAWLRALDRDRAHTDFDSAKLIVLAVPDLPLGKIAVLISIAAAQFRGQMTDDGNMTFRAAIEVARTLPERPQYPLGARPKPTPAGVHYKDEAFEKILRAAIHADDAPIADHVAAIWSESGHDARSEMADAWFGEGRAEQAIAATRLIADPDRRVSKLLSLARDLLDEAGAPNF
jgi:tetratricopeptide (TPR) repeat protein